MEEIEQIEDETAVIKEVFDGEVLIQVERKGACRNCSMNMLCMGNENRVEFRIKTNLSLQPGDKVKLHIKPESRLISSFVIFIFPVLMMLFFFSLSRYLFRLPESHSILVSLAGLLISGFVIKYVDKKTADKVSVEIIEKVSV